MTNNSYVDQIAFDGMRHHLARDFSKLYILDLGGNVRKNPKLSGTTHNVFGIQVGVSISLLIKRASRLSKSEVLYARMPEHWKRGQKYTQLEQCATAGAVEWQSLTPDAASNWLNDDQEGDFDKYLPLQDGVFSFTSLGISTNRNDWAYSFDNYKLSLQMKKFLRHYTFEQARYRSNGGPKGFVLNTDEAFMKWSETLLRKMYGGQIASGFNPVKITPSMYRPYCKMSLYFDSLVIDRPSRQGVIFPITIGKQENVCIWIKTGTEVSFWPLAVNIMPDLLPQGGSQCFAFYRYDEDGTSRKENVTDKSLEEFRARYADKRISKWNIFHATYAVLHHPEYRTRYAANLKRELPRIPFPPDFHAFAAAGKRLMELHIDYEQQPEYPLQHIESEDPDVEVTFRVTRMKLSKDKSELRYNDFLLLRGIPPATFDYRLGNRSALEWVIDQYRVTTDARSGITNDPNREDDPKYILRLIGQVITVSLETQQIIDALPSLKLGE